MNDQNEIEYINERLYNLDVSNEPIKRIMFYFNILHDVIDYPFEPNYLNFDVPYFKSYNEMQKFLSVALALSPKFLHANNVIIFYNNKNFYKPDQKDCRYEFKVINPQDASNPTYKKNYQNPYNIKNINYNQTQFEVRVNENIKYPHSEDSESEPEDYYYEEGLEDNYQINDDNPIKLQKSKLTKSKYQEYRKQYNEQTIEVYSKKNSDKNQMAAYDNNSNNNEDEEDNNEEKNLADNFDAYEVNIVNKLVVTKDWIDYIYNDPIKKTLSSMKTVLPNDDVIRTKSISLPKNIFFYMIIGLLIVLLSCAAVIINSATSLNKDPRFQEYEGRKHGKNGQLTVSQFDSMSDFKNHKIYSKEENANNDTIIIPCKKCYRKIKDGNILSIISGSFAIFFIVFVFCLSLTISCEKKKEYRKQQSHKTKKNGTNKGLNMIHIIAFSILTFIAIVISLIAEVFIIISLTQKTYGFIHNGPVLQIIMNTIIFACYILIIFFYFKQ